MKISSTNSRERTFNLIGRIISFAQWCCIIVGIIFWVLDLKNIAKILLCIVGVYWSVRLLSPIIGFIWEHTFEHIKNPITRWSVVLFAVSVAFE